MRSFLFVPGDSEKKQAKAHESGADALILDLEDSVALSAKETARRMAYEYISSHGSGPKLTVRMNALDTPFWEEDLAAIVPARPFAIMVPKTISGACLQKVAAKLDTLEKENGIEAGSIRLFNVATETALSLFNMGSYKGATPRHFAMTWGAEDLAADLGAQSNKDGNGVYTAPYQLARTLCLLGAVAAEIMPLDSICKEFRDEAALRAEARAALRDGFTAKMAIHPAQVPIINEVFTPTEDDLSHARAIVQAFDEAGDVGVVNLDGVMIDIPHLKQARRLIAKAEAARK